jgi:peptidoglycan/xylan/chitin deacetylase (PgdA/CDA1 family)
LLGALVAVIAAWLFPQRDDVGARAILGILFVAGVALAALGATRGGRRFTVFGVLLLVVTLLFTGYVGAETPGVKWFGGGTTHGPTNTRQVAITFDDGPDAASTPEIMAILDRYGVKATFFEVGKAIDKVPDVTRALYRDGQLLGNHSYHHDSWSWLDPRYPELQKTQDAFKRAIGTCPVFYRPPHGDRTPFLAHVVKDHNMHMVLWDVSSADWSSKDPQAVARRTLDKAAPGSIILLHDGLDGNPNKPRPVIAKALPLILDGLRARHLQPVRLDVLLHRAAYQPCS